MYRTAQGESKRREVSPPSFSPSPSFSYQIEDMKDTYDRKEGNFKGKKKSAPAPKPKAKVVKKKVVKMETKKDAKKGGGGKGGLFGFGKK